MDNNNKAKSDSFYAKVGRAIGKVMPYCVGLMLGIVLPMGLFNSIYGTFVSQNGWQAACGTFQILYGVSLVDHLELKKW